MSAPLAKTVVEVGSGGFWDVPSLPHPVKSKMERKKIKFKVKVFIYLVC
jgi:hypothetical protein